MAVIDRQALTMNKIFSTVSIRALLIRLTVEKANITEEINMRFISIFTHEPVNRPPTEAEMATMGNLIEEGMKAGWLIATEGVHFGANGVRVHKSSAGKLMVTDGPFAETKEVIGGYALLKAANKDEVVELTKRFLNAVGQGTCEIYQLYEMPAGE
jgi:hypothetical protein